MNVKKILFPVDLSDFSSKIHPQVVSVAEKFGAEIHLVAVLAPGEPINADFAPPSAHDPLGKDIREWAEQKLKEFEQEYLLRYRNVSRKLLLGQPAREILKYITSTGIDLVIMATHRKRGLERALLGSVADEVIKKSPVPVMSINPEEGELGWRVSGIKPEQELRLRPKWQGEQ